MLVDVLNSTFSSLLQIVPLTVQKIVTRWKLNKSARQLCELMTLEKQIKLPHSSQSQGKQDCELARTGAKTSVEPRRLEKFQS